MTDNMSDCADTSVMKKSSENHGLHGLQGLHGRSEKFIKAVPVIDADFLLRILELIASLFHVPHGKQLIFGKSLKFSAE